MCKSYPSREFLNSVTNVSFNAICENKILTKIYGFKIATCKVSVMWLFSVAEQTGLSLDPKPQRQVFSRWDQFIPLK